MLLWATEHLWGRTGVVGGEGRREGGGGEKDIVVVVVCSSYESLNMLT